MRREAWGRLAAGRRGCGSSPSAPSGAVSLSAAGLGPQAAWLRAHAPRR